MKDERRCVHCNLDRNTTNKERPYVCEPCLRTDGRKLILEGRGKHCWTTYDFTIFAIGLISIAILQLIIISLELS